MSEDMQLTDSVSTNMVAPSDALMSSVLKRTNYSEKGQQFVLDEWAKLQSEQPTIAQFIMATSYQMAPNDPDTRERISMSMIKFYILLSEATLQKDVTELYAAHLQAIFPTST